LCSAGDAVFDRVAQALVTSALSGMAIWLVWVSTSDPLRLRLLCAVL
jgi:hypothetical protein